MSYNTPYKETADENMCANGGLLCSTSGIHVEEDVFGPVCE